jgi:lipopolysaccharide transport system ATP-binding protein
VSDDVVIKVENLWKQYRYGTISHATLRKDFQSWWARFRGKEDPNLPVSYAQSAERKASENNSMPSALSSLQEDADRFWALKDVSFEVKLGEVLGIIGKNGAGKSTLLKIMSRVTTPTKGQIKIKGRVASLLEVGTGFHPELTGRENIFLNGAILGMTKAEIKKKFDEIVAFAEIDKFIDTPVKRYSSGMYVRLAFAVAAHLEPEILVVDEVLAVGDTQFQKKCLGKMGDVAREGRTVLFVSHNMGAILGLCVQGVLLEQGRIISKGSVTDVVTTYLDAVSSSSRALIANRTDRKGNQHLIFTSFELRNSDGKMMNSACLGEAVDLVFKYQSSAAVELRNVNVAIGIHGKFDENLFHLSTSVQGADFECLPPSGEIICRLPQLPLQPGAYSFNLFSTVGGEIADWLQNAGTIEVEAGNFFGTGKLPPSEQGPFLVSHSWHYNS